MSYDPSNPKDVKVRNRRERRAEERRLKDVLDLMRSSEGRRYIIWIIGQSGLFRSTMTGNAWTYFNEGMRNMGTIIYNDVMTACPDLYLQALAEEKATKHSEDAAEQLLTQHNPQEDTDV